MRQEQAFGIIPLRKGINGWEVLLILHAKGHWAFPKGHKEEEEAPKQTAIRELKEETNLDVVSFIETPLLQEHYTFHQNDEKIDKTNTYFLAKVEGEIVLQTEEVLKAAWLSFKRAKQQATFPQAKSLCDTLEALMPLF